MDGARIPLAKHDFEIGEFVVDVDSHIDENEFCELANDAFTARAGDLHATKVWGSPETSNHHIVFSRACENRDFIAGELRQELFLAKIWNF